MRKNLFIAAFFLPLIGLNQRVDLDRFKFSSQFRSLPAYRLDSSYRPYYVSSVALKK